MTFATSIQSFVGPHTGLGNTGNGQCTPDWSRGFVYIHSTNTSPSSNGGHVSKSSILSGAELGYVAVADINDSLHHVSVQPPSALKSDGNLFMSTQAGMCWLNTTTWTRNDTWGEYTSAAHPFGPPGPPDGIGSNDAVLSGHMCSGTTASHDFVYAGGLGSVSPYAHATFMCDLPVNVFDFTWPGRTYAMCSGALHSGNFWFLCGNSDASLGFFTLDVHHISVTDGGSVTNDLIKSINPTDIDAGWSFIGCVSVAFDHTDGHLLAFIQGDTSARYLAKLDSSTGDVIWQTAIPGGGSLPNEQMQHSNVTNGIYCFIMGAGGGYPTTVYTVDTSDGSLSTQTAGLAGLTPFGAQCFNTRTGAIILLTAFGIAADGPTPLNSTTGFSGWAALYVRESTTPPTPTPTPGSDTISPYVPPIIIPPVRQLRLYPRPPYKEYRCGTDGVSVFPMPFRIIEQSDLRVEVDGAEITQADFTYTGRDSTMAGHDTGYITLDTAASNCIVRVWCDRAPVRTDDLADGEFDKTTANTELETLWVLDRAQHLMQQRDTTDPMTGAQTLPAAYAGKRYWFRGACVVARAGSDTIHNGSGSGTTLTGTGADSLCELVCVKAGSWFVRTKSGSWSVA
jgi:hypothetical protein